MKKTILRITGALLALGMITSFGAAPAEASTTASRAFSSTATFYSDDISACIKVTLSGTLTATASTRTVKGGKTYHLQATVLKSPKVNVNSYVDCYSTKGRKLSGVVFTQRYYATQCSINTSAGIGISASGFGISVAATPTCGTISLAERNTSDFRNTSDSTYQESNTGTAVKWTYADSNSTDPKKVKLCIEPISTFRAYVGSTNDGGTLRFPSSCVYYPS